MQQHYIMQYNADQTSSLHAAMLLMLGKLSTLMTTDNGKVGDRGQSNQLLNFFVTNSCFKFP